MNNTPIKRDSYARDCARRDGESMRTTPQRLYERLLRRVYVPLSLVVLVDDAGTLRALCQFDTAFSEPDVEDMMREAGACGGDMQAGTVWLITHHPEGRTTLDREDRHNLRRLLQETRGMRVCAFVSGEETGCVKVWEGP